VTAACWQAGMADKLYSFVAPHGVLELPAIFMSGGAGLLLAKGLLFPGALPRKDSIAYEGGRAVKLVLGIVPMLIVAGTIEGFVSPSDLPVALKYTLAAGLFGLLLLYVKRKTPRQPRAAKPTEAPAANISLG
jgi:uncharacterized membrane protein SpoIIM required for sporulation